MPKSKKFILVKLFCISTLCCSLIAQSQNSKSILKDTIDGKVDFSKYILEAKGFLPAMTLITEPALGGFGVGVAPLFISPKKQTDSSSYVPPDITTVLGMYTSNNSWGAGALRIGSFPKQKMKYRIGGGYTNINLSIYKNFEILGEREFEFNFRSIPVFLSLSRKIGNTDLYGGFNYLFLNTKVSPNFNSDLPEFVTNKELNSNISSLGVFLEMDKRNSIFTPDKGFYANLDYSINANWTGSDYQYQRLNAKASVFLPLRHNWISGFRMEVQHVFDDPPFYLLPSVDMRGIPAARYQGSTTMLLATEQRYDINFRWSGLVFGGMGKALQKNQSFSSADLVYGVGGGFRYLLARTFNFRAGLDLAYGQEGWAYYFVFGHAWNR